MPDAGLTTTTRPSPSGSAGASARRPGGRHGSWARVGTSPRTANAAPDAQRRARQHVARVVHAGVDAGRGDGDRDRGHHGAPGLGLQRHAGREGRRRRRVPGREGGGDRLPLQLPYHRYRVQRRTLPAHRPLAERVDGRRGDGQRGDPRAAPPGGTAALLPSAAMPAAAPNHSRPWLALRLSRGSTGSAPGQCLSATRWNAARSRCWNRARQRPVEGRLFDVDMGQRIPCDRAVNQEARPSGTVGSGGVVVYVAFCPQPCRSVSGSALPGQVPCG